MTWARLTRSSRFLNRQLGARGFGFSSVLRNDTPSITGTVQPQKKPIGGFRGGYAFLTILVLVLALIE
jgi:hypothetical protein